MGKSKGPSGPQKVEQTSSNIPEFAKPFYQELMGRAMYETTRPYEAYPVARLADFDQYETSAMQGMADLAAMGDPAEIGLASQSSARRMLHPHLRLPHHRGNQLRYLSCLHRSK